MKRFIKWALIIVVVLLILLNTWFFMFGGIGIGIYTVNDKDFFDYDSMLFKSQISKVLGYKSLSFMNTTPTELILFKFSSNIITHNSDCSLIYINSNEIITGNKYKLSCDYIVSSRLNQFVVYNVYEEILDDINREKILNKGYKLPDKINPIIKLVPNKQLN